nr:MAG TPA: hypothetical protein [Caudoviricetes sp.]
MIVIVAAIWAALVAIDMFMIMMIVLTTDCHPLFECITWICTAVLCLIGVIIVVAGSASIIIDSLQ